MELRTPCAPPTPVLTAAGSLNPWLGRWQEAQVMVWSKDKAGSQNSIRPSATPSSVKGLSAGMSIGGKNGGISSAKGVACGLQSPLTHSTGSLHREQLPTTTAIMMNNQKFLICQSFSTLRSPRPPRPPRHPSHPSPPSSLVSTRHPSSPSADCPGLFPPHCE